MNITISINSTETVEINYETAATIAAELADEEENAAFLSMLAKHPNSDVRCVVAYKTCLMRGVLRKLAQDSSIEVVKSVANNDLALATFDLALIRGMIDRDVSVALTIVYSLHSVVEDIRGEVIDYLLLHDDPKVKDLAKGYLRDARAQNDLEEFL